MEIIKTIHLELVHIVNFLSLDIFFFLLKLLAITLVFILIRPAIRKCTGTGHRFNNFIDLVLKWFYTYYIFVYIFQNIIKSYEFVPLLSVTFGTMFLFLIVIPMSLHFLSFVKFLSLIANKYFQIGDLIKIDDFVGRVRKVTFFNAQLYQEDGNTVVIPLRSFFKLPIKVIHLRNFSLFDRSYKINTIRKTDELLKLSQFRLKNLPYDMDLENMKVKIVNDELNIKIKFGPSYIAGVFNESVDKLINNVLSELERDNV